MLPDHSTQLLAFYLPQFHPTPENDSWWGPGFTEWTNVARAVPLFRGHYQPHLPADLGFYDLRLPETMASQADLARSYGISGFCVWHYWFQGRRLLERPVDQVLRDPELDFPFCLAWANETWSRRWLGEERDVLIQQTYSDDDDRAHAAWLADVFEDPRYSRVDGRPIFAVYAPRKMPEPLRFVETLRTTIGERGGVDPFLVGIDAHAPGANFHDDGYDATLNFQPQLGHLPYGLVDGWTRGRLTQNLRLGIPSGHIRVYDEQAARSMLAAGRSRAASHRTVAVGWDNSPRRHRRGIIFHRPSPEAFGQELSEAVAEAAAGEDPSRRIVWINAWNEWAEGNHLEPDLHSGRAYLEQVRRSLAVRTPSSIQTQRLQPTISNDRQDA